MGTSAAGGLAGRRSDCCSRPLNAIRGVGVPVDGADPCSGGPMGRRTIGTRAAAFAGARPPSDLTRPSIRPSAPGFPARGGSPRRAFIPLSWEAYSWSVRAVTRVSR